jgi:hypothetical protein
MKDPWEKAYVYGRQRGPLITAVHIVDAYSNQSLCGLWCVALNRTPKPYPVCKNCLKTKRAKELGL